MSAQALSLSGVDGYSLAANTTARGIEGIGKGGILALISDYLVIFMIIFIGVLLLILLPIIIRYKTKKPSKLDVKFLELQQEREKFQLLSKRMIAEDLKDSTMVLLPKEQDSIGSLNLDNSILARKILYKMNEVEQRTRRLELGASGAQLLATLENIKDQEHATFKKRM